MTPWSSAAKPGVAVTLATGTDSDLVVVLGQSGCSLKWNVSGGKAILVTPADCPQQATITSGSAALRVMDSNHLSGSCDVHGSFMGMEASAVATATFTRMP
jgi:hypothetical protein